MVHSPPLAYSREETRAGVYRPHRGLTSLPLMRRASTVPGMQHGDAHAGHRDTMGLEHLERSHIELVASFAHASHLFLKHYP